MAWLQKILMCSEPNLEISQCAAQIWGLGQTPKRGPGAEPLVEGLGGRSSRKYLGILGMHTQFEQ